jgi:Ribosomal protein S13/S18
LIELENGKTRRSCDVWSSPFLQIQIQSPGQKTLANSSSLSAAKKARSSTFFDFSTPMSKESKRWSWFTSFQSPDANETQVMYALTKIKGVGRRYSNLVCKKADVDLNKRYG